MTDTHSEIFYRLDDDDCITEVGGDWLSSIRIGNAANLTPEKVIGRSLWVFVRDRSLRDIYKRLFSQVRSSRKPVSFPYRCDSPEARRYMSMTIKPLADAHVEVYNQLLREELRNQPIRVLAAAAGQKAIPRCSVCNQFRIDGQWFEVVDAVAEGLALDHDLPVQVIHGFCESCKQSLHAMTAVSNQ